MSQDILEEFKLVSMGIREVDIDEEKLTIQWSGGRSEVFFLKNLKNVALITTEDGPFMPDVFWWLLMEIPVMIPDDSLIPGSEKIHDVLFNLPGFNYELLTKAMMSTEKNVFELWDKD